MKNSEPGKLKKKKRKTLIFKYNYENRKQIVPGNKGEKSEGGGGGEREDAENGILGRSNTFGGEGGGESCVLVHRELGGLQWRRALVSRASRFHRR